MPTFYSAFFNKPESHLSHEQWKKWKSFGFTNTVITAKQHLAILGLSDPDKISEVKRISKEFNKNPSRLTLTGRCVATIFVAPFTVVVSMLRNTISHLTLWVSEHKAISLILIVLIILLCIAVPFSSGGLVASVAFFSMKEVCIGAAIVIIPVVPLTGRAMAEGMIQGCIVACAIVTARNMSDAYVMVKGYAIRSVSKDSTYLAKVKGYHYGLKEGNNNTDSSKSPNKNKIPYAKDVTNGSLTNLHQSRCHHNRIFETDGSLTNLHQSRFQLSFNEHDDSFDREYSEAVKKHKKLSSLLSVAEFL
jgi:hypothetical protein